MNVSTSSAALSSTNTGNFDLVPGKVPARETDVLMKRVLTEGDYPAFKRMFLLMYPELCTFCYRLVQVREVAEELVSDVFYSIWKNRGAIEVTSARAYLYTAVRNRSIDHLRKVKKNPLCNLDKATVIPSDSPSAEDRLIETQLNVKLERSIAALPRQCRIIFELSREKGLKYKEIAENLSISIKTVETQMGRALKQLRKSVETA